MQEISIRADIEWDAVRKMMAELQQPRLNQALSVAINATARQVHKRATSAIAKEMGLPVRHVRGSVTIRRYSTPATLEARVFGFGKPIKLSYWDGTQTPIGFRSKAWGKMKTYRKAFTVSLKTGHTGIFKRTRKSRGKNPKGYIKELWGPGVAETMATDQVSKALEAYGKERLLANVMRQLDRYKRGETYRRKSST